MKRVVIIGAGWGGLVTGYLLSQRGYDVTILEQSSHVGGCLQAFNRGGIRFDTGFHIVGGLVETNPMYYFFKELDLLKLPWIQLRNQGVFLNNTSYVLPCGHEEFFRYFSDMFPHEKNNLRRYFQTFKAIVSCPIKDTMPYWEQGAWNFLSHTIADPQLRDILSSPSMIMEMNKDYLPLFAYAEIMNSFITSTCRLAEGSQPMLDHLVQGIENSGSCIYCNSKITQILEKNGVVAGVKMQDGTTIDADIVIAAINPILTVGLLATDTAVNKVYVRRISNLMCSMGCFTVNIKLKSGVIPMQNEPIYVHAKGADMWNMDTPEVQHLMVHYYPEQNALDLLTPMMWHKVQKWNCQSMNVPDNDYNMFKQQTAEQCIALAESAIPDLRNAVSNYWTSTPLTWKNYINAYQGSAFGVTKDYKSPITTMFQPRTPLKGLYITGQSMILHGIMGTTVSAFQTAAMIEPDIPTWPRFDVTAPAFSFL